MTPRHFRRPHETEGQADFSMIIVLSIVMGIALVVLLFELWLVRQLREQHLGIDARIAVLEQRIHLLRTTGADRRRKVSPKYPSLPARSILNDFELPSLRGGNVTLSQWRGQRIAVVFVQSECPFSRDLIAALAARHLAGLPEQPQLILVSTGGAASSLALFDTVPEKIQILLQQGMELARVWRVGETPAAVFIDAEGVTEGEQLRGNAEIIGALGIDTLISDSDQTGRRTTPLDPKRYEPPRSPVVGDLAPGIDELLLSGKQVGFPAQPDGRTLIVFTDPTCAPCRALASEFDARIQRFPGDLNLLVVSKGDETATREFMAELGLTHPIIAVGSGRIARSFGMVETPSAVLLDAEWRVLEPPVIGLTAILDLVELARGRVPSLERAVR